MRRNNKKEKFAYELAGIKADLSAPEFVEAQDCAFRGDTSSQGLVCLTTMTFEGNENSGYSVPVKGQILGDVTSLSINGKETKFRKGAFYQRIHMMLKMGYNEIPVLIKDKFGNTTESYIETTIIRTDK